MTASAAREGRLRSSERWPHFAVPTVLAFMAVYIASAFFGGSGYDSARDVAAAYAIRHGLAWPLHGPLLGGAFYLGPLWFYLLALPLLVVQSWLAVALFVALLCSLQFPLAYATGARLGGPRLGLLWCALLALPGWGTFQLVGFAHTNAVPVTVMLVLYAVVRLAQEHRPRWLVLALVAQMLALHAHPATLPLLLLIAGVAVYALPDRAQLLRWSAGGALLAALFLLPLLFEALHAPPATLEQPGEYVAGMVHISNLGALPALFYALLISGPRFVADAFLGSLPRLADAYAYAVFVLETLALLGLIAAWRQQRRLTAIGLALLLLNAAAIALARPATPFYMVYALLPLLAGVAALGLGQGCALVEQCGAETPGRRTTPAAFVAPAVVVLVFALHVASVAGIARSIVSGQIAMSVPTRLDIKLDDPNPSPPETWLPAYAVGKSGALLCAAPTPVALHGLYAYLEDSYFGLDQRMACGDRDLRLLGTQPPAATSLVGLSPPLWRALAWQPTRWVGGMGVALAATVLAPQQGQRVPDGLTYPPYSVPAGPARETTVEARLPADRALVVSFPYRTWLAEPAIRVSANGVALAPLARDLVSLVYLCRDCPRSMEVAWRVEFASVKPDWIDVVSLAAPR